MKRLLIRALAATAATATAVVCAAAGPESPSHSKHGMPTTRDGVGQAVERHFARLDADRDGFVSKAEADAAAERRHSRASERMHKPGSALFERLDANKDGVVTRAEAEPVFASRQVDIAHVGPGETPPRRNWDALTSRLDTNRDGAISRAEFDVGEAQRAQMRSERGGHGAGFTGRMFEAADSNKDGRVSLDEAQAAATAHFAAADANGDGTLSVEERRAARRHKAR